MSRFIELLPHVATQPLAVVAYIVVAIGWMAWFYRRNRSLTFLAALDQIPKDDRAAFASRAGYSHDDLGHLPRDRRVRLVMGGWFFLGYIATLLAVVLIVVAALSLNAKLSEQRQTLDRLEKSLAELDQRREKLQSEIERDQVLAGGVKKASLRITNSSEIQAAIINLDSLIRQFETDFENLSTRDSFRVRLAKASRDVGLGLFSEGRSLISDDDLRIERNATESAIEKIVQANRIRGTAEYGLRNWQAARDCFEQVLIHRPNDWGIQILLANCAFSLGQFTEAIARLNKIVTHFTETVEREGQKDSRRALATSLSNRGTVFKQVGNLSNAIQDFNKAIDLQRKLTQEDSAAEILDEFAASLSSRGSVFAELGEFKTALDDFDNAIRIRNHLISQGATVKLRYEFAISLANRGAVRLGLGQTDEALEDFNTVVDVCASLVEGEDRKEVRENLARSFNNRGNALSRLGRLDDAIRDYQRAYELFELLVQEEKRTELTDDLADTINNLGVVFARKGKLDDAEMEFAAAAELLSKLVEQGGRPDLKHKIQLIRQNLTAARTKQEALP